jgi:hypothetical protein
MPSKSLDEGFRYPQYLVIVAQHVCIRIERSNTERGQIQIMHGSLVSSNTSTSGSSGGLEYAAGNRSIDFISSLHFN